MMKKDLYMHLRITRKITPASGPQFFRGNRLLQVRGTVKHVLGKTNPDVESRDGVTVAGILFPDTDTGRLMIKWGVAIVKGENFNRVEGCNRAKKFALEHDYITEHLSYEDAKDLANEIGQRVWKGGYKALDTIFVKSTASQGV